MSFENGIRYEGQDDSDTRVRRSAVDAASVGEPPYIKFDETAILQAIWDATAPERFTLNDLQRDAISVDVIVRLRAAATHPAPAISDWSVESEVSERKYWATLGQPAPVNQCEHGVASNMECLNCVEEYVAAPVGDAAAQGINPAERKDRK